MYVHSVCPPLPPSSSYYILYILSVNVFGVNYVLIFSSIIVNRESLLSRVWYKFEVISMTV